MPTQSAPRIAGIVATRAPIAVVIRRGPSRWTEQLVWNLETDEVIRGGWLAGRVEYESCDVSPDGRFLVGTYACHTPHAPPHQPVGYCVAVSRPPYFHVLAGWTRREVWGGGWNGPRALRLWDCRSSPSPDVGSVPPDVSVEVTARARFDACEIPDRHLRTRGWTEVQQLESELVNPDHESWARQLIAQGPPSPELVNVDQSERFLAATEEFLATVQRAIPRYRPVREGVWVKRFARGHHERRVSVAEPSWQGHHEVWSLHSTDGAAQRTFRPDPRGCQWLDVDHRGRVVFGEEGCLWAWEGFPDGAPRMVADLREHRVTRIATPPWAKEW